MQVKRVALMLSLLTSIMVFSFIAACGSSSQPASQPAVPSAADKAAMDEKAAMEAKAMAEKTAMDEKAAMEAKAMADKTAMEEKAAMEKKPGEAMMEKLPDQQFAAHFVDSNPKHGAKLTQVPGTITLNFNFTLSGVSTITVTKDGKQVNSDRPTLSSNKLSMTTNALSTTDNGTYIVDYKACWSDGSCHNGKFAFTVGS